jgi:thiamine pyrophosphate-dependent acetolactate synthase large subunit-like protein
VKAAIPKRTRAAIEKRGEAARAHAEARERNRQAAAPPGTRPISTARMVMETWGQIKNEDWSLVAQSSNVSNWPHRLWPMGFMLARQSGSYGVGYGAPAASVPPSPTAISAASRSRSRVTTT